MLHHDYQSQSNQRMNIHFNKRQGLNTSFSDRSSEIYSKLENEYEMLKQLRAVWLERLGHLKVLCI